MQLFKNKTVFQQKKSNRHRLKSWSQSLWTGNDRLILAALAHQSNVSERTHNTSDQMVLCKSKTQGSLIREPDSRKQTMGCGHACKVLGGWYRHSPPSSGSMWWCWWTDRWAVRHCNLLVRLPPPGTELGSNSCQQRSLTDPDQKCCQHKGCAKHILQMFFDVIRWLYSLNELTQKCKNMLYSFC